MLSPRDVKVTTGDDDEGQGNKVNNYGIYNPLLQPSHTQPHTQKKTVEHTQRQTQASAQTRFRERQKFKVEKKA
jgi:hypothetical protein